MALKATHIATGEEIDLDRADEPEMAERIAELYQRTTNGDRPRPGRAVLECREHDGPDGPHHRAWVYLRRDQFGRWVLAHFDLKYADHTPARMTDQHRWQQDYWQRAGDAAGYETAQERRLKGVRLDVAIIGPKATIGVEVQHSALTRPAAIARTRKARDNGVTSLWSADRPDGPPKWAYRVPTVLTNELPDGYAPRGSWTVVNGARRLVPTRCARPWFTDSSVEGFGGICPTTARRRPCGAWHPRFTPRGGLTVDHVAEQAPAGALIPLTVPANRGRIPVVYIVTAADADLYAELASGTYNDPEQSARDATETANVGKIGPCQAAVPTRPTAPGSGYISAQRHASTYVPPAPIYVAPAGYCRFCAEPLSEAQRRSGISNHLSCWQNQGVPGREPRPTTS
ncbi:hypothetical protein [Pseudonocardia sp. H11422]|uniref:hypothetical protein n=1 Tax=Pseudonocardia sp. H11422 TaxID=2835866 RepID=UPI001BDBDB5B|nr:hypothetical protein [Pseudonocardia sp. H11422]